MPRRTDMSAAKLSKPKLRESEVLKACMDILEAHPKVELWWRQNTGSVKFGKRFVKFSFKGAPDLMAVMKGGHQSGKFLSVECKATGKKMSGEQLEFWLAVNHAGGYAICVDDPQQLIDFLG